jgi:hypothetical protein
MDWWTSTRRQRDGRLIIEQYRCRDVLTGIAQRIMIPIPRVIQREDLVAWWASVPRENSCHRDPVRKPPRRVPTAASLTTILRCTEKLISMLASRPRSTKVRHLRPVLRPRPQTMHQHGVLSVRENLDRRTTSVYRRQNNPCTRVRSQRKSKS